jgi:succinoglycan biosynthesis transport protein ExoP
MEHARHEQSNLYSEPVTPRNLSSFDLTYALAVLKRWALIILTGAVTSAATAFVVSQVVPKEYEATVQLFIAPAANPTVGFQDVVLGASVARSYVQLVKSEVVLSPAMAQFGWTDLKGFTDQTRASQVLDTSIITVSFRDHDPKAAADIANAIANSFIKQTRSLQSELQGGTVAQLQTQIDGVSADIKSLDEQISALRASLAASPRPGQSPAARAEDQALLQQLDSNRLTKQQTLAQLLKTRDDISLAGARAASTVSLWQDAIEPREPVSPRVLLNTLLGLFAGTVLTLTIVFFASYFDERVLDFEQVEPRLGLVPLAQVHLGALPTSLKGKLFVRDSRNSSEAESFRALRTNIQYVDVDRSARSILVTSALPGEGKSVVSANLALAFAQSGVNTILVDCDLRRPSQHRLCGVSAAAGVTTLLTEPSLGSLTRFQVAPNLWIIPSGPLPPNPAELLGSARMASVLAKLPTMIDNAVVIIDTSPVLAAADAVTLAARVDGVLFVVDSGRTRATSARRALQSLRLVRARLLGAVLNKVTSEQAGYYYYYYGYGNRPATASSESTTRR